MRKTFRYRIYMTKGQRRLLEAQLETCRWVYNQTLAERKRAYEERGESLRLYDTQAMLPEWKRSNPGLKGVHSQVLQNVQVRVDHAFQSFFRRVRQGGEAPGYPRFKSQNRYDSMTYPQYGNGVRQEGERLILSKVGAVRLVLHRPIEGTPKTVTLTRSRTGKWFACFSCDVGIQPLPVSSQLIALERDPEHAATRETGEPLADPGFRVRDEADLQRVQRRKTAARTTHNWPQHTRQLAILARIRERMQQRRTNFAHQQSRALVNRYQVIVFEDRTPEAVGRNRDVRRSFMDAAWAQLVALTLGKAAEAGRHVRLLAAHGAGETHGSCQAICDYDPVPT